MISPGTVRTNDNAPSMGAVAAASAVGTTIEWYDFLIYATAASLVLNKLFSRARTLLSGSFCRSAQLALVSSLAPSVLSSSATSGIGSVENRC
jgi:hypothetical protein